MELTPFELKLAGTIIALLLSGILFFMRQLVGNFKNQLVSLASLMEIMQTKQYAHEKAVLEMMTNLTPRDEMHSKLDKFELKLDAIHKRLDLWNDKFITKEECNRIHQK